MAPAGLAILILAALIAIPLGVVAVIYLVVPVFKAIGWLIRQVFRFIFGEIGDALRFIGALITWVFLIPLVIGNIVVGRWSASAHYGRAMQSECVTGGRCLYRMAIGHPARLLCLTALVDGIENRIPQAVAAAPGADRPSGKAGQFDGYRIVGSLPGGGSGGKLYVAVPNQQKLAAFARSGWGGEGDLKEVVIKCFSLSDGSSLPQIVRENRALDAAKRLGLILEHELTADRFFYVMRYVPGEALGLVTQRLHAASGSGPGGGGGLARKELSQVLDYTGDLLRTLTHYHAGGLWHKDVKPDNIIISGGQAHLVDFGLVTPLRSALTLTTHGTEYFRDPEMVRMALKGVKVQDVDGTKFDIYAAGAVLFSMIENSFPAHGGLSQISRSCPESLRWIVRRAMTDYDKRYESAAEMLADVESLQSAPDPFAVKPADLPSVRVGGGGQPEPAPVEASPVQSVVAAASPVPPSPRAIEPPPPAQTHRQWPAWSPAGFVFRVGRKSPEPAAPPPSAQRTRPNIRVASWWSGRYAVDGSTPAPTPVVPTPANASFRPRPRVPGMSAADQLKSARDRAASARARAHQRMRGRAGMGVSGGQHVSGINSGVAIAVFAFLAVCVLGAGSLFVFRTSARNAATPPVPVSVSTATRDTSVINPAHSALTVFHAEPAAPPAPGSRGRALVMRDSLTLTGEYLPAVNDQIGRLRAAGFDTVGNVPGPSANPDDLAAQDTLVAQVRNAVGFSPFRSSDAAAAIRAWLAEHTDFTLALWIGPTDDHKPLAWIIYPPSADEATTTAAEQALAPRP